VTTRKAHSLAAATEERALEIDPAPHFNATGLILSFNHGEFHDGLYVRREIPPLAFLVASSGFLECRVTLRPA
jgi:hypothetical protein